MTFLENREAGVIHVRMFVKRKNFVDRTVFAKQEKSDNDTECDAVRYKENVFLTD